MCTHHVVSNGIHRSLALVIGFLLLSVCVSVSCSRTDQKDDEASQPAKGGTAEDASHFSTPDVSPSAAAAKHADHRTLDLGGGVKMEFIFIGPGEFTMGSPANEEGRSADESPQHPVKISKGFWLAETEVTQAQYQALMGNNPSSFKGDQNPVEQVSWDEAKAFCAKLSQKANVSARLPSEAEWEYACRAGTTTPFSTGATISTDQANHNGNTTYGSGRKGVYRETTTPVKSFAANPWDLYDMHGNVWEWCADVWHENYTGAPPDGRAWTTGGDQSSHVFRGGSWIYDPPFLRSALRNGGASDSRSFDYGFRPALDSN